MDLVVKIRKEGKKGGRYVEGRRRKKREDLACHHNGSCMVLGYV